MTLDFSAIDNDDDVPVDELGIIPVFDGADDACNEEEEVPEFVISNVL